MVHFPQNFLSLSVPITLFFHPKKPPVSQNYFLFPSQNAVPFLIPSLLKTHFLLSLSNQELTVRECLTGGFLRAVSHESFVALQAEQHAAPRDSGHCVRQAWVSFSKHSL